MRQVLNNLTHKASLVLLTMMRWLFDFYLSKMKFGGIFFKFKINEFLVTLWHSFIQCTCSCLKYLCPPFLWRLAFFSNRISYFGYFLTILLPNIYNILPQLQVKEYVPGPWVHWVTWNPPNHIGLQPSLLWRPLIFLINTVAFSDRLSWITPLVCEGTLFCWET